MNLDVRRALEGYLQVRRKAGTDSLFVSTRGDGIKPHAVENLVKKYARFAGLEDVTPHTLRHSFGKQPWMPGLIWCPSRPCWGIRGLRLPPSTPHQASGTWSRP